MIRKQYKLLSPETEAKLETSQTVAKTKTSDKDKKSTEKVEPKLVYTDDEVLEGEEINYHMTRTETRARRDVYQKIKERVKQMEKNNTSKLIIFRDYRAPWFKAGGRSAVYYAFDVAGKLGKRNINLNVDKDGYATFHEGIVSFHGIKNLLDNMMLKADYAQPKILGDGWIIIFDLKHEYTKAELRSMEYTSKERRRKLNELILPENCYPSVYNGILAVTKRISPKIFKLNPHHRQAFAPLATEKLLELHTIYLKFTKGELERSVAAVQMQDIVTWLTSLMKVLLEANLWDVSICAPIGQALADLTKEIETQIVNGS